MNWIAHLHEGLFLPANERLIAWGAPRNSFRDTLTSTSDWEVKGDRYGHAIWRNVQMIPEQAVGVLGLLRGAELYLWEIQCAFGDRDSASHRKFQYATWQALMEDTLGAAMVDVRFANSGVEQNPTLFWLHYGVRVILEHYFTKDGSFCGIRVTSPPVELNHPRE